MLYLDLDCTDLVKPLCAGQKLCVYILFLLFSENLDSYLVEEIKYSLAYSYSALLTHIFQTYSTFFDAFCWLMIYDSENSDFLAKKSCVFLFNGQVTLKITFNCFQSSCLVLCPNNLTTVDTQGITLG